MDTDFLNAELFTCVMQIDKMWGGGLLRGSVCMLHNSKWFGLVRTKIKQVCWALQRLNTWTAALCSKWKSFSMQALKVKEGLIKEELLESAQFKTSPKRTKNKETNETKECGTNSVQLNKTNLTYFTKIFRHVSCYWLTITIKISTLDGIAFEIWMMGELMEMSPCRCCHWFCVWWTTVCHTVLSSAEFQICLTDPRWKLVRNDFLLLSFNYSS